MATLDDLLKMPGVMAAGEFSADGKLVGYKAKMEMSPSLRRQRPNFARPSR